MKTSRLVAALLAGALLPFTPSGPAGAADPPTVADGNDVEMLAAVSSQPGEGVLYRGKLYFAVSSDAAGYELWVTDGTAAGTRLAVDVEPGAADSRPSNLVVFQDRLYFSAMAGGLGDEWWSTDGTQAGTRPLADIYPGAGSSGPREPVVVGDRLYFSATDGAHGRELWSTAGTESTTQIAADIWAGAASGEPRDLTSMGDRIVYAAYGRDSVQKPWVSVPGVFGAARLDNLSDSSNLAPREFTRIGAHVVFASDSGVGVELWVTGGAPADARVLQDIDPGPSASTPSYLTHFGGRVIFQATTRNEGAELWSTDGTPGGTVLVHDINNVTDSSSQPSDFTVLGDQVLFAANDGRLGLELWSTQGVPGTTRLVADTHPGPADGLNGSLGSTTTAAGRLLFSGLDAAGLEPWTTDGTAAGTRRLADLAPGIATSWPAAVGTIGNRAIFGAYSGTGWALYAWTAMGSTTAVKAKKNYPEKQARKKKIVLRVRVVDEGGVAQSGGTITLTRKGKVVGTAPLVDGTARVRIKVRLKPGRKHRVFATWSGSTSAAGSTSAVVSFKVKKAKAGRHR